MTAEAKASVLADVVVGAVVVVQRQVDEAAHVASWPWGVAVVMAASWRGRTGRGDADMGGYWLRLALEGVGETLKGDGGQGLRRMRWEEMG